jgi:hypothetical protein
MSAVACKTALESLTNIDAATCFLESNGATSASLVATLKFSNAPEMNNINKHNGSPLASAFACDTSRLDGAVVFLPVLVGFAARGQRDVTCQLHSYSHVCWLGLVIAYITLQARWCTPARLLSWI